MEPKRVLIVLAPENFQDSEYLVPKKVLEEAGIVCDVTAKGTSLALGANRAKIAVTADFATLNPQDYSGIIFVGGMGATIYFDDSRAHDLAKIFLRENKVVGAICIAPTILANAGILDGKSATAYVSQQDALESKGADYTGELVTADDRVVTANGPQAAIAFGEKVRDLLQ